MKFFKPAQAAIDAQQIQKKALARRLAEIIARNKNGLAEEKRLKQELANLMLPNETVERINRKVISKFSPTKDLEHYLKEKGLWKSVTFKETKVIKDRVVALAETDKDLKQLLDKSYKTQNRFNILPPEIRL